MIAAAIAMLIFASPASAQKDAAEKAKEGGIEHWIEYYKSTQPKPSTPPAPERADQIKPGERAGSDTPSRENNAKQ